MEKLLEKLITGIVLTISGIAFLRHRAYFIKGALDSEIALWKFFHKERSISEGYQRYARIFVLVFGLLLLIGGVVQLYQFLILLQY